MPPVTAASPPVTTPAATPTASTTPAVTKNRGRRKESGDQGSPQQPRTDRSIVGRHFSRSFCDSHLKYTINPSPGRLSGVVVASH